MNRDFSLNIYYICSLTANIKSLVSKGFAHLDLTNMILGEVTFVPTFVRHDKIRKEQVEGRMLP